MGYAGSMMRMGSAEFSGNLPKTAAPGTVFALSLSLSLSLSLNTHRHLFDRHRQLIFGFFTVILIFSPESQRRLAPFYVGKRSFEMKQFEMKMAGMLIAVLALTLVFAACPTEAGDPPQKAGLYNKAPPILSSDIPIDLSAIAGDNILEQSFSYITGNDTTKNYTLLLDTDLEFTSDIEPSSVYYNLTIIGIGKERTISTGRFYVGRDGANKEPLMACDLTLGENIYLKTDSSVWLGSGSLTMQEGSKITDLYCNGGYFNPFSITMNGGTISNAYYLSIMVGDQTFTISGNANIENLILDYAYHFIDKSLGSITIASEWSGNIGKLMISDNLGGVSFEDYLDYFNDAVVLKAAAGYTLTEMDVAKILTLGDVRMNFDTPPQPLSQTHKLQLDTVENVIKLVRVN
jgi:hypothetical protein